MYKDPNSPEALEAIRASRRKWYHKNKARQMRIQKERARDNRARVRRLKETLSCQRCGFSFAGRPQCCDFHHRDRATKKFSPNNGATYGWNMILAEIAKCDPLCANCHREHHGVDVYAQAGVDL